MQAHEAVMVYEQILRQNVSAPREKAFRLREGAIMSPD